MAAKLNVAMIEQWISDGEARITKLLLHREREIQEGVSTARLDERVREFERHLADWRQLRLRLLYGDTAFPYLPRSTPWMQASSSPSQAETILRTSA